jgi:hypothetical protein
MRICNRCILKLYSVKPAVNSQPGFRQGLMRQVPYKDMDKCVIAFLVIQLVGSVLE